MAPTQQFTVRTACENILHYLCIGLIIMLVVVYVVYPFCRDVFGFQDKRSLPTGTNPQGPAETPAEFKVIDSILNTSGDVLYTTLIKNKDDGSHDMHSYELTVFRACYSAEPLPIGEWLAEAEAGLVLLQEYKGEFPQNLHYFSAIPGDDTNYRQCILHLIGSSSASESATPKNTMVTADDAIKTTPVNIYSQDIELPLEWREPRFSIVRGTTVSVTLFDSEEDRERIYHLTSAVELTPEDEDYERVPICSSIYYFRYLRDEATGTIERYKQVESRDPIQDSDTICLFSLKKDRRTVVKSYYTESPCTSDCLHDFC